MIDVTEVPQDAPTTESGRRAPQVRNPRSDAEPETAWWEGRLPPTRLPTDRARGLREQHLPVQAAQSAVLRRGRPVLGDDRLVAEVLRVRQHRPAGH